MNQRNRHLLQPRTTVSLGLLLLTALFLASCERKYVVITDPGGAEVFTGGKKIGNTPVKIVGVHLANAKKAGGYLVQVRKNGYADTVVVFPDNYDTAEMYVILEPEATKQEGGRQRGFVDPKVFSGDMLNLLAMQMQVIQGQDVDTKLLDVLARRYPDSGTANLILALDAYQKNQVESAEIFAQIAKERAPDDAEIVETANGIIGTIGGSGDE